jgi:hypothetical protein
MTGSLPHLAQRELRELMATSWFIGPALIALMLAPFTVYVGLLDARTRQLDHDEYVERVEEARHGGRRTLLGNQIEPAMRLVRHPSSGSVFVRGLDDIAAPYWDLSPAGVKTTPGTRGTASVFESSSTFDLGFLLRTVIGLIAITLGASSIAREQRRGTLKALFVAPVTARVIIVARMLGGALLLALLIAVVVGAAVATLLVFDPARASADLLATVAALAGLTFLYTCVLFVAGLITAEITRTEATAVAAALVLWLLLSLVIVPGAAFIGRALMFAPARALFESRRDEMHQKLAVAARERLGNQLRQMIGPDTDPDDVPFAGDVRAALEISSDAEIAATRRTLNDMEAEIDRAVARQHRVITGLALLSPGALFLDAAANVAGTGNANVSRWHAAVERYHDALQSTLFDRPPRLYLIVPGRKGPQVMFFERRPPPVVGELPRFDAPDEPLTSRLQSAVRSSLVLLLYLVLGGAVVIGRFRYRPSGEFERANSRG